MPKAKIEYNIDLQCSLCPKNPKFSDVSHLLTHISSKSHLAHRFKLQIRSQNEPEARNILDTFDLWYHTSNLDTLLSERLAAKDQKKSKKSRAANSSKVSNAAMKQERGIAPVIMAPNLEASVYRAPIPPMQGWHAPAVINETSSTIVDDWDSNMYSTPTVRRQIPNFALEETPFGDKVDPKYAISPASLYSSKFSSLVTPWKQDLKDENGDNKKSVEKLTDSAKLKGILWPGMNLFDSATPDMKRMRNQKKENNVLETMIATSLAVEPAEISYHPNGEFRASRYIFGPLSTDNSPSRSASPKKRRTARKPAPALNDLSVNAPRLRAPRGRKPTAGRSPRKSESTHTGPPVFLQPPPTLNPLVSGLGTVPENRRFLPSVEEDEEFRMTIGGMGLQQNDRKKRTFSIFQDALQASPSRTETPLEDHGFEFSHGLPVYPSQSMTSGLFQNSPTPACKPTSYGHDKENGQLDMHHMHQPHHARRAPSDSHVYPPQVFYDTSYNPLYNHAYARSFAYNTQYTFNENKSPGALNPGLLSVPGDYKQSSSRTQVPQSQGSNIASGNSVVQNNDVHFDI